MEKTAFCFDFDGTVTRQELLPLIASELNIYEEIQLLTKLTLNGMIPFESSFKLRVKLLSTVPVKRVGEIARRVLLDSQLAEFIRENSANCFIVTGNLDVWIQEVIQEKLQCDFFSSEADMQAGNLVGVRKILNKGEAIEEVKKNFERVVAIGDSMNDCAMFTQADVGIAYGATHEPVGSLVELSDYLVYHPKALLSLLNNLKN